MSRETIEPELILPDEKLVELGQDLETSRQEEFEQTQQLSPDEAKEKFNVIYAQVASLYEKAQAKEQELVPLARMAGSEYIPVADASVVEVPVVPEAPVVAKKLSRPTKILLAKYDKLEVVEVPKTQHPLEMGQVILHAAQDRDKVAERAFASPTFDTREHRRASSLSPETLHAGEMHHDTPKPSLTVENRTKPQPKTGWDAVKEDLANIGKKVENTLPWLKDDVEPVELHVPGVVLNAEKEAQKPVEATERTDGYYFNDKKVSVSRTHTTPEGNELSLEVVDDEGNVNTVPESQLEIWLNGVKKTKADFEPKPGTEVELYRPTSQVVEVYKPVVEAYKGDEKPEEVKTWFAQKREQYGVHFWNAVWKVKDFASDKYSSLLNNGVEEGMGEKEIEDKRKHNRIIMIAGAAALGSLVVGGLAAAGVVISQHAGDVSGSGLENNFDTGSKGSSAMPEDMRNLLNNDVGDSAANSIPGVEPGIPRFVPFSNPTYNVPHAEGGLSLFEKLNIDPQKWTTNEDFILKHFEATGDVKNVPGKGLELAHSGWLSSDFQFFIESLR